MAAERADKVLVNRRVRDILEIRLAGARLWDVRSFVAEKQADLESAWFVGDGEEVLSDRQLRRYWLRAGKLMSQKHDRTRKAMMRRHLAQRQHVYARAVNVGDLATAARVLKDEAELGGLYPAKKVAPISIEVLIKKADEEMRGMTDEQLATLVQPAIPGNPGTAGTAGD